MPRTRRCSAVGLALAVLTLLTGCTSVVNGDGAPVSGTRSTETATSTTTGASAFPTDTATTTTGATTAPTTDLAALLAPGPSGSRPWGTAWSRNDRPTLDEFVAHVYPASSTALAKSQLKAQGIKDIAHRTWIAKDANQADVILLRFDTATGAVSRYRSATAAKAGAPGQRHFDVPGFPEAVGYYSPVLDELGDVRAIVYGQVGAIVVEVFFYSPEKLDETAAVAATTAQLSLLPS